MGHHYPNYSCIKLDFEKGVAIVQFNRPDFLNAVSEQMVQEYDQVLELLNRDTRIRIIITTGNERAYCTGSSFKSSAGKAGRRRASCLLEDYLPSSPYSKPKVAMIAGYCTGGGLQQAMTCDVRIAADNARFILAESKSLSPGHNFNRQEILPRILAERSSHCQGRELVLNAQEAYRKGLVDMVIEKDLLKDTALGLARLLAAS